MESNQHIRYKDKRNNSVNFIDKKLVKSAHLFNNFNKIPPIIGFIIANQYGNTLITFEYNSKNEEGYRSIKSYLSEDKNNFLDMDLISMYFSSFITFAGQTNIQNLSNLEIHGSNIKVQIFFLFDKYMIIMFLNSNTELNGKDRKSIMQYFEDEINKYEFELQNFNASKSRKTLILLENKGKGWLKKINKTYLDTFKDSYLKKIEIIEEFTKEIDPIIEEVLCDYLEYIQKNIVNNISKEIKNKIQEILFGFNSSIPKE